jgi:hypothetical protein
MTVKTNVFVENLNSSIGQWDVAFDNFQANEYPTRLLAQAQYRKQIEVLKEQRRVVEERLSNFKKRMEWPR